MLWMYLKWIKTLKMKMKTMKKQNKDIHRSNHHLRLLANLPIITSLHKHITTKARILIRDREPITLSHNKNLISCKINMEIMQPQQRRLPGQQHTSGNRFSNANSGGYHQPRPPPRHPPYPAHAVVGAIPCDILSRVIDW